MEWIVENYSIILYTTFIVIILVAFYKEFLLSPKEVREDIIYNSIFNLVVEADRLLHGKSGQEKLNWVYTQFVNRFPYMKEVVTFNMVSKFVDNALHDLEEIIKSQINKG